MKVDVYNSRTNKDWVGLRVVFTEAVTTNAGTTAHAGTIARVTRKFGGLDVQTEMCEHCGVSFRCKAVPHGSLSLGLPGICMYCGCTEDNACEDGCSWRNEKKQNVCTAPECTERFEDELARGLVRE